ncbi:T-cell activation inhibitor, mitochondrial-like [Branchiostoma lanceolatum]|uniref:T-cell activation inhibitor, mitochondrial-like n=1 Tax=Branchiostoma lanceolatum TaxID=7740 RepID=UPI003456CF55
MNIIRAIRFLRSQPIMRLSTNTFHSGPQTQPAEMPAASNPLRPFYFAVHPDLFGQFPREKKVNESSLKQLNGYLESIQAGCPHLPPSLKFYIRKNHVKQDNRSPVGFKSVQFTILSKDFLTVVEEILSSCDLPTCHLEKLRSTQPAKSAATPLRHWDESVVHDFFTRPGSHRNLRRSQIKKDIRLRSWVSNNMPKIEKRLQQSQKVRETNRTLETKLCGDYGVQSVDCDCELGCFIVKSCLQSFLRLCRQHPDMTYFLKGKTIMFSNNYSGVSADGQIVLSHEDVWQHWFMLISSLPRYEALVEHIPVLEKQLSALMSHVKVRRDCNVAVVMAVSYAKWLQRLIERLQLDGTEHFFSVGNLSKYRIVLQGENSTLRLSQTGQFLVPVSCPPSQLVHFIRRKLSDSHYLLQQYDSDYRVEREEMQRCQEVLELTALRKDHNVSMPQMISCCQRLSHQYLELSPVLMGARLRVTQFYSITQDGDVCIPWNWRI